MPNQPDPGDGSPAPRRPPPGRRPPGGQPTPHDSVFRRIFGVPANAASQLRAVLPPGLAGRLDLGRLTPVPASFVDEALKWRYSDLLFTAPLDGRHAYVYLLAEHQSSADPLMAFRMLRYFTDRSSVRTRPDLRLLIGYMSLTESFGCCRDFLGVSGEHSLVSARACSGDGGAARCAPGCVADDGCLIWWRG
jgi:hypothetical protein